MNKFKLWILKRILGVDLVKWLYDLGDHIGSGIGWIQDADCAFELRKGLDSLEKAHRKVSVMIDALD